MSAHRALEESILTDKQNTFKRAVGQEWVNLVYRGFFFEPLRENLESFLVDSQKNVTGEVLINLSPGKMEALSLIHISEPTRLLSIGCGGVGV